MPDELSFEETVDEGVDDVAASDGNSLDLSDGDELSLDEADTTIPLDNDELDSTGDLEFEAGLSPEPSNINDDLSLDGDALEAVTVDNDVPAVEEAVGFSVDNEVPAVEEPVESAIESDSDNEIEDDLFSGLDENDGSEDDWLSDLSDDISSLDDDLGDLDDSELFSAEDEVGTKLDLARAYIDMGDNESAKGILDEVVTDGNDDQKKDANELIERIA